MSFLHNILAKIQTKTDEIKEKKQFLDLVEDEAKPIRRQAYLDERKRAAMEEGKALAKIDGQKKMPQKKPTKDDFGLQAGINDPMKFLNPQKTEAKKK